jgi:bifunctional DNase/RNase
MLGGCRAPRPVPDGDDADLRAVLVEGVRLDENRQPVLTLLEKGGELRRLPIWIGRDQAESIHVALAEIALPRPNTHDLIVRMLGGLERELQRVAITELRDSTYYAVIDLAGAGGPVRLDARPSDAIALAVRTGAAIFVAAAGVPSGAAGADARGIDIDWGAPRAPLAPLRSSAQSRSRSGV